MAQKSTSNTHEKFFDPVDVGPRYSKQPMGYLGSGNFGIVVSAYDGVKQQKVAIKNVQLQPNKEHLKRMLREIYILKRLRHNNIIGLVDVFHAASARNQCESVYLVLRHMPTDLGRLIERGREQLTSKHVKWLTYSLLCGLRCIHSAGIIHRDLKPQNILVDENSNLKICDFGLARIANDTHLFTGMTETVATLYYRAPEVTLTPQKYDKLIDIWSVGCILAEMLTGKVLFEEGKNGREAVKCIIHVLGTPVSEGVSDFDDFGKSVIEEIPFVLKRPWKELVGEQEENVYNLLDTLLAFMPNKRVTSEVALRHQYFDEYRGTGDESFCVKPWPAEVEIGKLSAGVLLNLISTEIKNFQATQR